MNFFVLLLLYILGEFYLQTIVFLKRRNKIRNSDESDQVNNILFYNTHLPIYSLLYVIPFSALFFMIEWWMALISLVVIVISYFFINLCLIGLYKKVKKTIVFILIQILHIAVLVIIYQFMSFDLDMYYYYELFKKGLAFLIVIVPIAILMNMLKADVFKEDLSLRIFDANGIIEIFERLLVLVFAWFDSFIAIAIILGVKIFVRINDFKDDNLRNKYVLETIVSITITVLVSIICRYI